MSDSSIIVQATGTGDITTQSAFLRSVVLTAGSGATGTVVVRAGGSGGTIVLSLSAVANTSTPSGDLHDALCKDGIHVTMGGAGSVATVVYA